MVSDQSAGTLQYRRPKALETSVLGGSRLTLALPSVNSRVLRFVDWKRPEQVSADLSPPATRSIESWKDSTGERRELIAVGWIERRNDGRTWRRSIKEPLDMNVAENVEMLPQTRSGNYGVARFNALRHGVLSQYAVLPWEDEGEYHALIEALAAEHSPQGPTEEHLVEELAGIIWRKRRLRMAEAAAHHRALKRTANSHHSSEPPIHIERRQRPRSFM